jgi:hypothetical protein
MAESFCNHISMLAILYERDKIHYKINFNYFFVNSNNKIQILASKSVLRSRSRSCKELHLLVGAGAVTQSGSGSGSDNGIKHG